MTLQRERGEAVAVVTSAAVAKFLAPIAAAAFKHFAKSAHVAFKSRNKLALPDRAGIAEMADFIEANLRLAAPEDELSEQALTYSSSPECTTLMEHMVTFRALGRPVTTEGPLRRELSTGCARYGLTSPAEQGSVFAILVGAVDALLEYAGVTAKEDIREQAAASASVLINETYLQSIDAQIELLTRPLQVGVAELESILVKYKTTLRSIAGKIQPPNFDGTESVALSRLFVVPAMTIAGPEKTYVNLDALIDMHRVVVLGDPGGGKTTLVKKVALEVADRNTVGAGHTKAGVVPFIVVLRDFGTFLTKTSGSVTDFISEMLRATYQISLTSVTIEYLLTVGRARVVFDGLDELLDPRDRQRVADIVTAFGALYSNAGILVTSRRVGYLQAPLPTKEFTTVGLEGFDDSRVETYVENWFGLIDGLADERRQELVRNFIQDSNGVPDLRSSPLMLALICTIYRFEGYIPRNRPDVYEKCAKMLFDRWDRHRGLREQFDFEAHIEPALMSLAHRIYLDSALQSGITERELVKKSADYLDEWQYGNRALANRAAERFVAFCRGRAWVFTDVGLTPDGESLYAFTHRTFLEYFTAAHLARTVTSFDDLIRMLVKKVRYNEWDVVAQLALQIRAKSRQGGPDLVASSLITAMESGYRLDSRRNLIAFLSRCLAFLPLSPRCAREVGTKLIRIAFEVQVESNFLAIGRRGWIENLVGELLDGVSGSTPEVKSILIESTSNFVVDTLEGGKGKGKAKRKVRPEVHELAASTAWVIGYTRRYLGDSHTESKDRALSAVRRHLQENHMAWGKWAPAALYYIDGITPESFVKVIPIESIESTSKLPGNGSIVQPLHGELGRIIADPKNSLKAPTSRGFALVGEYATQLGERYPVTFNKSSSWLHELLDPNSILRGDEDDAAETAPQPLPAQTILDAFLLLALLSEVDESAMAEVEDIELAFGRLSSLAPLLAARAKRDGELANRWEHVLPEGNHRNLILRWASGSVDLWKPGDDTSSEK
jgi:NACHT domain